MTNVDVKTESQKNYDSMESGKKTAVMSFASDKMPAGANRPLPDLRSGNEADQAKKGTYRRLIGYLAQRKGRFVLSIVLILLAVAAYALAPYFTALAIDDMGKLLTGGFNEEVYGSFLKCLVLLVACYALYAVLSYLSNLLIISVSQDAIYRLRKDIDRKLDRLPLNYYDTTTYGDILARLTNDVEIVSQAFQEAIFEILKGVLTMVLVLVMMLALDPFLTVVGLVSIPVLLFFAGKVTTRSQPHFDAQMATVGELNGYVEEYYTGHNVVALFGKETFVKDNFETINEKLRDHSERGQFLAGLLYPMTQGANFAGYALVCLAGAVMAILGGLSVGMIQAFTQYLTQFTTPINTIMELVSILQQTRSSGGRIFEFLDEAEEVPDPENPKFPENPRGSMQFEHVRFGYLPHQTLISDLNYEAKAGTKTAIVGPTGCGKTTLINLIMRFYDVKGGSIKIDGVDVRDMRRDDLRSMFGMVLQETWLETGTVMDNIRYGKLDATDEEVIAAAKAAHADAFIETLPGGYQFILQEGASNIAQGQRQLITIARAMLSNPRIMILDEATSSVDTRTEVLIQEAMNAMMKDRTSFVVAHRLSTIKDADTILYMQDGDILEIGTHDELMEKDGLYAKLYNSQFAD